MEETDPVVSAVVELHPRDQSGSTADEYQRDTAKIKAHFTSAGFEVHAPFHSSFSIGAKRSQFESYFGDRVIVEEEGLATAVTVEGGGRELRRDKIPDDVAGIVKRVFFMPPPDFVPH